MSVRDDPQTTLHDEAKWKRTTFGSGLVKGLGITLRHLFSRSVTVQYPDEKDPLPPRSRGVIALKEENCTMCMLCGRECPDWCIYIEGHKERREPKEPGKRAKAFNVLDRFAIDYALCMYCGICVEVCPYDALFWSPAYEYAEYDIVELTHEKARLSEWMYQVLPPSPLDEGARGPEFKKLPPAPAAAAPAAPPKAAAAAAPPAPPAAPAAPAAPAPAAAPAPPAAPGGEDPAAIRERVLKEEQEKGSDPRVAEARAKAAEMRAKKAAAGEAPAAPAAAAAPAAPAAPAPAAAPAPPAAPGGEDPAAIRERVLKEEQEKGSDPRVAEARAKAAEMRAKKAAEAGPAPAAAAPAAAAPAAAAPAAQAPAAQAPAAEAPAPEAKPPPKPASGLETLDGLRERIVALNVPPETIGAMTPDEAAAVRAKVYEDEIARGTEPKVAESLARLAEVVALQGFRRPDWK